MRTRLVSILFIGIILSILFSCRNSDNKSEPSANKTHSESLAEWQDMKFGMFVHWGPVSLKGTEIGWSRGKQIPFEEYDNLYKNFNPELFDAKEWINIAKKAGMKYFVITSKHHDGFSIFHSDYTDYDIGKTPFKRDVLKELSDACYNEEIMFGTYYSILDWYHPDYPLQLNRDMPKENANMDSYISFMKSQVMELVKKYRTNIMWFDGEWEDPWTHEEGLKLYSYVRSLKDNILINNRVDKGRKGMQGMTKADEFAGDYGTPEQEIGAYNIDTPWESCITICTQWAWKPDDKLKSSKECIQTLIRVCGGGGNLLLNVGPMPDGRIEPRQVEVLTEIGKWLDKNGESIYETKGGPFKPTENFASTKKDNKIFLHLMNNIQELNLKQIDKKINKAYLLNGNKVFFSQENEKTFVKISEEESNKTDVVVVLELQNANSQ
ncbi:alpha-L-fucosidase [Bacteroidota bacterium]